MPTCSVPYCTNASSKNSRLTFHEFPHETPLFLNKWLENIGRPNWHPGVRSVVCGEHFVKDDFDRKGQLHIGSFPTKFPESPFRKKKKEVENTSCRKSPSPIHLKETVNINGIPPLEVPIKNRSGPRSTLGSHSATSSLSDTKTSCVSVPEEACEVISEQFEIKIEKDISLDSVSEMTELASKSPSGEENNRKRKFPEETKEVSSTFQTMASVSSTFSLASCRICGNYNKNNTGIFSEDGKKLGLAQMIRKCLGIEVSESETLPLRVCLSCIAGLKTCNNLITNSEMTNNLLKGSQKVSTSEKTNNIPKVRGIMDGDPVIIHSRPIQKNSSSKPDRRLLLLEMALKDGVPVKSMMAQAIEELTLRLLPKEMRKTKPQGRIMFLDLLGDSESFSDQLKSAISMLFHSPNLDKPSAAKSKQNPASPTLTPKPTSNLAPPSGRPPPLILKPKPPVVSSSNMNQNIILQTAPILTLVSDNSLSVSPMQLNALPQTLPSTTLPQFSVKKLLKLPSQPPCGLIQIQPKPNAGNVPIIRSVENPSGPIILQDVQSKISSGAISLKQISVNDKNVKGAIASPLLLIAETGTVSSSVPAEVAAVNEATPLQTIKEVPGKISIAPVKLIQSHKPPVPTCAAPSLNDATIEVGNNRSSTINVGDMKDKLLTKINNMGNQFKLGDKIVGIVVKNSDSSEDIQKKIQSTFLKSTQLKENEKAVINSKERIILPKGSTTIQSVDKSVPSGVEVTDGAKRLKDRIMDICPVSDNQSSYFERRNIRKLSLSFLWRKTGFLVSSYQKLFTWQYPGDTENDDPLLTCRVCKFVAKSRHDIENHLQVHPDLQCGVCYKYFLTAGKVKEHINVIHQIPIPQDTLKKKNLLSFRCPALKRCARHYQCSRCERRFKLKDFLKRHYVLCKEKTVTERVVAVTNGNFLRCPVCNRTFSSNDSLQDHMIVHAKRTSWLCDVCGMVLKSPSNYRSHVARHDEKAHEFKYQCKVCKKRFKLEHRYEEHRKTHDIKTQFVCYSCGKVFRTVNGLRQHEILHGERKFQCRHCPSRFHRRDHCRIHETTHSKEKPTKLPPGSPRVRMFSCRFCPASEHVKFPNMRMVLRHYEEDHHMERGKIPGLKKYTCDICNKNFHNTTLLKHHMMWHNGQQPYHCSTCGAGFMVKERLRNHEWTHTNERPFKCQLCDKGFRSRNCLKQHKLIHKDPSEYYKCKFCDKGFSRIDNLRTHTRVHTGEKPWKCLHCSKQFRLRSDCSKHLSSAHDVSQEDILNYIETVIDPYNSSTIPATSSGTNPTNSQPNASQAVLPESALDADISVILGL